MQTFGYSISIFLTAKLIIVNNINITQFSLHRFINKPICIGLICGLMILLHTILRLPYSHLIHVTLSSHRNYK
jgi:hypothetical protein